MRALVLSDWNAIVRFHDIPGAGRPLIFLHGLGCSSSSDYPAVAAHAGLSGRRRILVDFFGFGFSDAPEEFSYGVEAHAETVLALLSALGISQCDLYGHSMGGTVAVMLASMKPDLVSSLIVSEPNLDAGGGMFSRRIAEQAEHVYVSSGHQQTIREAREAGNDIWAGTMAVSSALAVHRSASSLVKGAEPSWRERLEEANMPRTFIFGEYSLPAPDAERLPAYGVNVKIVPGAGHSMAWENPTGLADAIAESLDLTA